MYFDSPYVALRTFLKMFWSGRTGKKNEKRTVSKIAVLLGRYHSGEPLNEPEHQLLTTAIALRNDLERVLEIAGWLPPVDQKTLTALRRALGGHFGVCVRYQEGSINHRESRASRDERRGRELAQQKLLSVL